MSRQGMKSNIEGFSMAYHGNSKVRITRTLYFIFIVLSAIHSASTRRTGKKV